jgi:hypothetical protein
MNSSSSKFSLSLSISENSLFNCSSVTPFCVKKYILGNRPAAIPAYEFSSIMISLSFFSQCLTGDQ